MKDPKNHLGKGLAALLGEAGVEVKESTKNHIGVQNLSISSIQPGAFQPRRYFDPEKLSALVESIRDRGVLQPLIVRKLTNSDLFEIIAGERRWRAAKEVGLQTVPIVEIQCNDTEALEIGLIENLQRDDLNPIEEAESLQKLMLEHHKTQDEVARAVSKSRSYVANMVRLNGLPENVKTLIRENKISSGHARTLITAENVDELVKKILEDKISVRETERLAKSKQKRIANAIKPEVDPDLILLGERIQDLIEMPTKIDISRNGGTVKIFFKAFEELDFLVNKLSLLEQN